MYLCSQKFDRTINKTIFTLWQYLSEHPVNIESYKSVNLLCNYLHECNF